MRTALFACAALLALGIPARQALSSAYLQAEAYYKVRDRAQLVETVNREEIQTQPGKFTGKLLEIRGPINGIVESEQITLMIGGEEGSPAFTVALPPGRKAEQWPFLSIGVEIRALCQVVTATGKSNGSLELVIPVKDSEAVTVERERVKAAEQLRQNAARHSLGSRGVSGGTVGQAVRPGEPQYSEAEKLAMYASAVRYFNRRVAPETARSIAGSIIEYSRKYGLDARLVMAVIACESNFNPHAVSPKGAMGLGQLMPGTASGLGVGNAYNPRENLEGSTRLLRGHIASMEAGGRPPIEAVKLALACYNAGAGAVRKYRGIPPYKETQNYVAKITRLYWQMLRPSERTWNPD